ncbi:MAG: 2-amino-4-hydroxy-6-hydroxymethyldihydropteridine diphosphokinase [Acidobacteria bacterium]|nr:2-amino-4-hydroxy-6-hydroxymethyldihydropteridine diphosphokinase [Acidobacteriota bacterium]
MPEAWIGLGSNLGRRREHLRAALWELGRSGHVLRVSSLYETEPVGAVRQDGFLNAVLCLETQLPPRALLGQLMLVESGRGRVRVERNGPRTLDLDLLFYDDAVIEEAELLVPHPRLHERRFVLVPLCELAPGLLHPVLKRSLGDLLEAVEDRSAVIEVEKSLDWTEGTQAGC